MLIEIIGNDKDKLKKLFCMIKEFEDYCYKETEFWNMMYFKLGLTCMIDINTPKSFSYSKRYTFSTKVHDFLVNIRTKNINETQKLLLFTFIKDLKKGT